MRNSRASIGPTKIRSGKRFMIGRPDLASKTLTKWVTVVGVVGDTKMYGLANPSRYEFYLPLLQTAPNDMSLLVKSRIDPTALTSAVRGVVAGIDKDQPIFAITQEAAINRARDLNPDAQILVERVRNTDRGHPDKWRKP